MALSVDLEARTISVSIRELAESAASGPRGMGLLGRARAELGQRVHASYRAERGQVAGFKAEVPVSLAVELDGFEVSLGGRIDGLIEGPGGPIIEEVKSVTLHGGELAHADAALFPDFTLQLRLYALALAAARPDDRLTGRLILYSLLDETRHEVLVDLAPEETERELLERLRDLIAHAEWERTRARRLARIAGELKFPYDTMRPHQQELIDTIASGLDAARPVLAMAPTGIGKTVSALLAGLRFALGRDAHLFFLTAKNTQQILVQSTFEQICTAAGLAPGDLKCLTLRAKERMCPPETLLCHPEVCPYLKEFLARLKSSGAIEQLLAAGSRIDPEAVLAVGEAHRLCPHGVQLALAEEVNLVIGDYNYVYDPGVALHRFFGPEADRRAAVVVDEAHNLFDRARGYYSPAITRAELAELAERFRKGEFLSTRDREREEGVVQDALPGMEFGVRGPELFGWLRGLCRDLDAMIGRTLATAEQAGTGQVEDCRPVEADLEAWQGFAERAAELIVPYALYNRAHRLVRRNDPVVDLLARVTRILDVLSLERCEFVPYVSGPHAPDGEAIGVLCVNPAERLERRHRQVEGTVAMSATLTPLSYYQDVLGFPALDPLAASLSSPFPGENLDVLVARDVSTTYRERARHYETIARIVERTAAARPGKYAAYFPSFKFLADVRRLLELPREQVLIQHSEMSGDERELLLEQLRQSEEPRLLLAVMGGVFAEGIDLPGEDLIGAVVVGPGLPQVGFERALMQQYFQEHYEQGFAYAMLYPGLQRVIQSAGRVIRTPEDRGVIVLVGQRFAGHELLSCLPEHWYAHAPEEMIAEDLEQRLARFWRGHR